MAEVGWRDLQALIVGGWEWKEKTLEKWVSQTRGKFMHAILGACTLSSRN